MHDTGELAAGEVAADRAAQAATVNENVDVKLVARCPL